MSESRDSGGEFIGSSSRLESTTVFNNASCCPEWFDKKRVCDFSTTVLSDRLYVVDRDHEAI